MNQIYTNHVFPELTLPCFDLLFYFPFWLVSLFPASSSCFVFNLLYGMDDLSNIGYVICTPWPAQA